MAQWIVPEKTWKQDRKVNLCCETMVSVYRLFVVWVRNGSQCAHCLPRHDKGSANQAMTPLHFAARKGSAEVVRLLLKAKADKDKATLNVGTTPMQPDMNLGYFASWLEPLISCHFTFPQMQVLLANPLSFSIISSFLLLLLLLLLLLFVWLHGAVSQHWHVVVWTCTLSANASASEAPCGCWRSLWGGASFGAVRRQHEARL